MKIEIINNKPTSPKVNMFRLEPGLYLASVESDGPLFLYSVFYHNEDEDDTIVLNVETGEHSCNAWIDYLNRYNVQEVELESIKVKLV